ncbi:phosphoglucosamine mutase [Halanaeroarchaeum sulfurireducens]|uniref:Phosphohexomutase n=1 Tax=Halanaeroarchaeum sulfurireducens TaxID=1604004 RepID=A0A0F7P7J2_9EURY|nr:phosphoglucosamine mutase [Halanaeroarchaeum sulfurireducens]AKH96657.1 phosphohexomutase (phosphoglucomutase; phosphomannomutase) [Halanaeroarchaeum sulfurireducens]ALG81059.1 phosphohexomutase [Halanaeroarchaeum sulfurireducens]
MDVFGSSGVRGVANEELTPSFALRVALAAGTVWDAERVAVARDTRTTGRMLANAATSGLQSAGVDVDRLGVVPTPALQSYCEAAGVPGVMITASHNPPEYNGVKLVGADGIELPVTELERIEEVLVAESFETTRWDGTGSDDAVDGARRRYLTELLAAVDRDRIADAELTVAIDPGNGAGAFTSPEFFRRLGCDVVTVNAQGDGHFPGRDPEPVVETLDDLGALVRAADADVGIAHDGDADRAVFFDETGAFVEGDTTLAALAAAELEPGDTTVSAVTVSQRLVDVVDRKGAELELTSIGSTHIMTRIRELREAGETVPVAGEGNGGVIFPSYRVNRDGAYTAARFLELLADAPASEVLAPYDGYENVRVNVPYETDAERDRLVDAIADYAEAAEGAEYTTIDGYRLDYGDAWVLARPSGTEPVVRIYAEARERSRAATLVEDVKERLRDALDGS